MTSYTHAHISPVSLFQSPGPPLCQPPAAFVPCLHGRSPLPWEGPNVAGAQKGFLRTYILVQGQTIQVHDSSQLRLVRTYVCLPHRLKSHQRRRSTLCHSCIPRPTAESWCPKGTQKNHRRKEERKGVRKEGRKSISPGFSKSRWR